MDLKLKLNTAFARFEPSEFMLKEDEMVQISIGKALNGKWVLFFNTLSYCENDGVFSVPASVFKEYNEIVLAEMDGTEIVKKWKVGAFVARFPKAPLSYQDELEFYKRACVVLESEIKELKTFRQNATEDIKSLVAAVNELKKDFETVKEEMAI